MRIKELALATCIVLTTSPDVVDVLSGVCQHVLKLSTTFPVEDPSISADLWSQ